MKEGFETMFVPGVATTGMPRGKVLVLAPHPDDEILGCGGAMIQHVDNGDEVHVIVATDGRYGDPELTPDSCGPSYPERVAAYVALRQGESQEAAALAGYTVSFWNIADRGLEYGELGVRKLLGEVQHRPPVLVYAPSLFEMHPDHRALAMIAVEAVRRSGPDLTLVMYELVRQIPSPNVLLDISDQVARKRKAAQCFQSQLALRPYDEYAALNDRMRTVTLPLSVQAAEAYLTVTGEELRRSPLEIFESEYRRQRRAGLAFDPGNERKVSVIVRAIDRPELRAQALDSIALQTYPNIEVVLVDAVGDGSLASDEWCGRFPLVTCSEGEPLGRGRAANLGLDHSSGDYLIFLDDDDWFEADHVAALVAAAAVHPEARVFHANVRAVDSQGVDQGARFDFAVDPLGLLTGNSVPIHAVLFERSLLDEGCRFDESLAIYEDWDFWIQVSARSEFHHVEHLGAAYRFHGDQTSGAQRPVEAERGRSAILQKWRLRMSDEQFERLMAHAAVAICPSEVSRREAELVAREEALARVTRSRAYRLYELLLAPIRGITSRLRRS